MASPRTSAGAFLTAAALVGGLFLCVPGISAQPDRPGIGALLDTYASGQFDEALKPVASATRTQARTLRSALVSTGHRWIHAKPDDLGHRILAAAGFALEVEAIRAEKGEWEAGFEWCTGRCGIEWACTILRARGEADEAERVWHRASFALAGGVRDWSFLLTPLTAPTPRTRISGHALHALVRLPDDPHARLARAVAAASRNIVADEMDAPRLDRRTSQAPMLPMNPYLAELVASRTQTSMVYAQQQFIALLDDRVVGPEARMRLGYLLWRAGQHDQALAAELGAADATTDPNLRYLAHFIAGLTSQSSGRLSEAEAQYSKALDARPHSQSATIALAALQFLRGDAGAAYDAIDSSRTERPRDDDPWRLFLYGDYPQLGARIADLRKSVMR